MNTALAFGLLLAALAPASAGVREIKTIEVYGTTRLDPVQVRKNYLPRIERYLVQRASIQALKKQELAAGSRRLTKQRQRENAALMDKQELEMMRLDGEMAEALSVLRRITLEKDAAAYKLAIETEILRKLGAAWVALECMESYSFDASSSVVHVTVEVVEPAERAARMPFRPRPLKKLRDPYNLLAAWSEYSELGWQLVGKGQLRLDVPEADCGAFFCLWNGQTAELKAYENRFVAIAPSQKMILLQIAQEEADASRRVNAAFLLSYALGGKEIGGILTNLLRDPSPEVRSAALQVLGYLAVNRKDVLLPIGTIAAALDFPTIEDRNKALAVAIALSETPLYRPIMVHQIAPRALKLLRSTQPTTHDLAHSLLRGIFKEPIGEFSFDSWAECISKAQKELSAPPQPS